MTLDGAVASYVSGLKALQESLLNEIGLVVVVVVVVVSAVVAVVMTGVDILPDSHVFISFITS